MRHTVFMCERHDREGLKPVAKSRQEIQIATADLEEHETKLDTN